MKQSGIRIIVVKNGIPKEVKDLPMDIVRKLEEAYDREKVIGVSKETFLEMANILEWRLKLYYQKLDELESDLAGDRMYLKSIAFCQAFGIYSDELLQDALMWVDRSHSQKKEKFSSKNISCRELTEVVRTRSYMANPYIQASREFKAWARGIFERAGLRVGFVKFCKFYYAVICQ